MSKSTSILTMQRAVMDYIKANIPKDKNQARIGTLNGDNVRIGSRRYFASYINDMDLTDGDQVVCLLPDNNNNIAAVVGKI